MFKTNQDIAEYALEKLKKAGADKASAVVMRGRKDEFNAECGDFSLMRTLFNDGLALKAIKSNRKGEIVINKVEKDEIDKAVEQCIQLAASAEPDEAEDIAEKVKNENFDRRIGGPDKNALFDRTKEFLQQVSDEYPLIVVESLITSYNSKSACYLNSNGVQYNDETEHYDYVSMFAAKDGELTTSFNYNYADFSSLKNPIIDMGMQRTLLDEAVRSLKTRVLDNKFVGKVIVTPACEDMIWGTLFGSFLTDYALVTETSRWKDNLGDKVTDSALTMRLSPYRSDVICGERFTGDGYLSEDMDIIKDGILKSFVLSLYGANKTGKPRAASTAMENLEVMPGSKSLSEMIKGVDKGILVNRFSGASPGPSGEISGIAKNSFLIENGVVTDALLETMLSFNVLDVLQSIPAVSKERVSNGSSLLPWCCFDGVTVSGSGA